MVKLYAKLKGNEKEAYLVKLQSMLSVLSNGLKSNQPIDQLDQLKEFGEKNSWDWGLIPSQEKTYKRFSELVGVVAEQYSWFQNFDNQPDSKENRFYYDNLTISPENGLPAYFETSKLHMIKNDVDLKIKELDSHYRQALDLRNLMWSDEFSGDEKRVKANEIRKHALQRNFLNKLKKSNIVNNNHNVDNYSLQKISDIQLQSLWNLTTVRFNSASGLFQMYTIDFWIDDGQQLISGTKKSPKMNIDFLRNLYSAEKNSAWYMLSAIDDAFDFVHPTHAMRMYIGPYDNKFVDDDLAGSVMLPISRKILENDQDYSALRAMVQYSFSPTTLVDKKGRQSQEIYQEDWNDVIVVAPGKYLSTIADTIKGSGVRFFES